MREIERINRGREDRQRESERMKGLLYTVKVLEIKSGFKSIIVFLLLMMNIEIMNPRKKLLVASAFFLVFYRTINDSMIEIRHQKFLYR